MEALNVGEKILFLDIHGKGSRIRVELTMNALFKKIALLGTVCALVSCSESAEGIWKGECRNETIGSSSGLQMTIKQDGDKLKGILVLEATDLYGSGVMEGFIMDKDVTLRSEGDGQTFVNITWVGRIKGDTIKGTYRVEPTPSAALLGRNVQKGTFIVNRK